MYMSCGAKYIIDCDFDFEKKTRKQEEINTYCALIGSGKMVYLLGIWEFNSYFK